MRSPKEVADEIFRAACGSLNPTLETSVKRAITNIVDTYSRECWKAGQEATPLPHPAVPVLPRPPQHPQHPQSRLIAEGEIPHK